jgi:hypothetical protein
LTLKYSAAHVNESRYPERRYNTKGRDFVKVASATVIAVASPKVKDSDLRGYDQWQVDQPLALLAGVFPCCGSGPHFTISDSISTAPQSFLTVHVVTMFIHINFQTPSSK